MWGQDDMMIEPGPTEDEAIEPVANAPMFTNVKEDFDYYDSVVVYHDLSYLSQVPPGWFTTFQALAAASRLNFFDVRNRANTDLAYCNVETRDMTAYAMLIDSISVSFWSPANKMLKFAIGSGTSNFYDAFQTAFWDNDLPRHCSLVLRVQQDERLKTTCMMAPSGAGPVAGGFGIINEYTDHLGALHVASTRYPSPCGFTQGEPHITNQWPFPEPLQIPRRAALSVSIELNEYARTVIAAYAPQACGYQFPQLQELENLFRVMPFGITVAISGKRLVQQRGQLHA